MFTLQCFGTGRADWCLHLVFFGPWTHPAIIAHTHHSPCADASMHPSPLHRSSRPSSASCQENALRLWQQRAGGCRMPGALINTSKCAGLLAYAQTYTCKHTQSFHAHVHVLLTMDRVAEVAHRHTVLPAPCNLASMNPCYPGFCNRPIHHPSSPIIINLLSSPRCTQVFITGHGGNEFMKFQDQQELMSADVADVLAQVITDLHPDRIISDQTRSHRHQRTDGC